MWTGVKQRSLNTPQHATLLTFPTLQLNTGSIRDIVGGVTLQAVVGACAESAVVYTGLAGPLLGVVESLRTGVQTHAFIEVTLHLKLIWRINSNFTRKPHL